MIDTPSVAPPSTPASSPAEIWQTRLVAAKSEGLTAAEIATRHGVAESTVFAWRKRLFGRARAARHARRRQRLGRSQLALCIRSVGVVDKMSTRQPMHHPGVDVLYHRFELPS